MKRRDFLQHLAQHNCTILREGRNHPILQNNINNHRTPLPRHREIPEPLVKVICKQLDVPKPS